MATSDHMKRLMGASSWIRRMFEEGIELKKQVGEKNVFDFSLGNPITEPPEAFFKAFKELADNPKKGLHRYMPNLGFTSTREKIAQYYSKEFNHNITLNDVILTNGAAGAINVFLKSILDPANEVIVFTPFFAEYRFYIDNHQGRMVVLPCDEDFIPDLKRLEKSINYETVAIILNTPNNPTGKIYPSEFYKKMVEIVRKRSKELNRVIYIISDEPYRKIVYDNKKNPTLFDYYEYSVFVTSHSKDLALAGERIGYLILHPELPSKNELLNAMAFSNRILGYVNAPATMQYLIESLLGESVDISSYQYKRDLLYNALIDAGYDVKKPEGAFYLFVKSPIPDDIKFIQHLKTYNILTVPGVGFGLDGYFRISYAVEDWVVEKSLPFFKQAIENLPL
ncbi:pyridoxal phosphate-dependent aminotransferase [bacterium]|nr:pyridoxal phosphate-dependent aminotransferase [bacterium]